MRLKRIVFYPVESQDAEERMFRAGQLHIATSVPLGRIDAYRRERPEVLRISPFFGTMYLRANVTRSALADARVRRALGLAIDREALTQRVLRGGKIPARALTPPVDGFEPPAGFFHDPAAARALLAEAGHEGGAGLPPLSMLYPTSQNGQLVAEAIQEMWRVELGVEVRLRNQEWKVYLDSVNTLDYDLAISIWAGDYADPLSFLDLLVTDGGNNRTGFSDAEYDSLVRAALDMPDDAERRQVYARLEAIIAREAPVVPICHYASVELVHPAVRGWNPNILDQHPWKHVWLEAAAGGE
ncbi:MAG: peptide ABC transporter substrate-binding protein [Verrucomicrobia bacterium]|nr:MAG: peptide ABC transporter substrate-binding protein [Verrucomicrobiota bacterium]